MYIYICVCVCIHTHTQRPPPRVSLYRYATSAAAPNRLSVPNSSFFPKTAPRRAPSLAVPGTNSAGRCSWRTAHRPPLTRAERYYCAQRRRHSWRAPQTVIKYTHIYLCIYLLFILIYTCVYIYMHIFTLAAAALSADAPPGAYCEQYRLTRTYIVYTCVDIHVYVYIYVCVCVCVHVS